VPDEGAILWVTAGAVPSGSADPAAARRLLLALADPELAALTTREEGYATPSEAARDRLPRALREDTTLFPDAAVLRGCRTLHDLGPDEALVVALYDDVVAAG
jgi:spermidine/putrescine-binding protein